MNAAGELSVRVHALGRWTSVVVVVALAGGCPALTGGAGDRPEGFRLVEGSLTLPDEDLLGRQVTGLQIAALHVDADGAIIPFVSDVFDPAVVRAEAAFVVPVPAALDHVLVLQVPTAGGQGAGAFLGQLRFEDATLVPRGDEDLNLGAVQVVAGVAAPADTSLVPGPGGSPLQQTDSDNDGVANANDDDDDDDGTGDGSDADVAGDGVDDAGQVLAALPDDDGDQVPDALQR
jgi:hypothetical protein